MAKAHTDGNTNKIMLQGNMGNARHISESKNGYNGKYNGCLGIGLYILRNPSPCASAFPRAIYTPSSYLRPATIGLILRKQAIVKVSNKSIITLSAIFSRIAALSFFVAHP